MHTVSKPHSSRRSRVDMWLASNPGRLILKAFQQLRASKIFVLITKQKSYICITGHLDIQTHQKEHKTVSEPQRREN